MNRSLAVVLTLVPALAGAVAICEPGEAPLFMCETDRPGKFAAICAVEAVPGKKWSAVQYRFGATANAEMAYPPDLADGARKLFFSHAVRGRTYHVEVRFRSGAYTYRVSSAGDEVSDPPGNGAAGVLVTDKNGKTVADIQCIERPTLFASYLRAALACDPLAGTGACAEPPPHRR